MLWYQLGMLVAGLLFSSMGYWCADGSVCCHLDVGMISARLQQTMHVQKLLKFVITIGDYFSLWMGTWHLTLVKLFDFQQLFKVYAVTLVYNMSNSWLQWYYIYHVLLTCIPFTMITTFLGSMAVSWLLTHGSSQMCIKVLKKTAISSFELDAKEDKCRIVVSYYWSVLGKLLQ